MSTLRTVAGGRWMPTLVSLLMLGLLCGLIVYWAMQLLAPPVTIAPSGSLVNAEAPPDTLASGGLFGSANSGPAPVQRRTSVKVEVFGILAS
ncbi:MAG: hypothetical protein WA888_16495, partial [Burkholderiaceae bacterium]